MRTTRLARRLGLDGNPLRRRTDKIAACLAALLLAVFLTGAPVLSVRAVGWAGHTVAAGQQAARSWRAHGALCRVISPGRRRSVKVVSPFRTKHRNWWPLWWGGARASSIAAPPRETRHWP